MESELGWAVESHRCMVPQWRVHTVGRTPRDASERLSLDARRPAIAAERGRISWLETRGRAVELYSSRQYRVQYVVFKTLWDLWLDVDTKLGALHLATSHENDRSERARRARGPPGESGPHARVSSFKTL